MKPKPGNNIEEVFAQIAASSPVNNESIPGVPVKCYYRNNPDGSIRWIWPASLKTPLFLKFYNNGSARAVRLSRIIRTLFRFRLQRIFASGKMKLVTCQQDDQWALFAGTAGINQTAVFYTKQQFYKIAVGSNAPALLKHEFKNISDWTNIIFENIEVPDCSFNGTLLKQNDIAAGGTCVPHLKQLHWKALAELSKFKSCIIRLDVLPEWKSLDEQLSSLQQLPDERLPQGLIRKLKIVKQSIAPCTSVPASLAHGDFTPWNMFVKKDKLALIDWELAKPAMPLLYDAFHFLYQQGSLADHVDHATLSARIGESMQHPLAQVMRMENDIDIHLHHQLYILFTATYYLQAYAKQAQWHPQVAMSFATWNNSLNQILMENNHYKPRQLLITDVFDFLGNKQYAALKWLGGNPAELPEESDIDLCLCKKDSASLIQFLRQHQLVKGVKVFRKSFMCTLSVILQDDSLLSIDCISEFKRKATVMLDAGELLRKVTLNAYGVKIPSVENDFTYIWLFYLLNNQSVPEKYRILFDFFSKEWRKNLNSHFHWNSKLNTRFYTEVFEYNKQYHRTVIHELSKTPANKGFSKIRNRVNYFIDTVRENFFHTGFIITFSGVDGAGKSTIIQKMRHQIEKRYRRKVVVLRHRPAVLPMLTAWKEGSRAAAELKAANSMPRQGNNKSFISSVLRFGYYYTDYLLGQFVIYFRYVLRGYVVLYDRYYFDFINDGKRSNINLPASFTRFGYNFLLKPRFNFFLYADEQVILQRKKELDGKTIRNLTGKYISLFSHLEKSHAFSKYISIENNAMPQTLQTIHQHVKKAALS